MSVTSLPVIESITPANGSKVGASAVISTSASSAVGIKSLRIYIDGDLKAVTSASTLSYTWKTAAFGKGGHTVRVTVIDAKSNSVSKSIVLYK